MRNSRKPGGLLAKSAKLKRFRQKRLMTMGKLTPVSGATVDGQVMRKGRRPPFKEIPSGDSQNNCSKDGDIAGELKSGNLPSNLNSGSGVPAGQMPGENGDAAKGTLDEESPLRRVKESEGLDLSYGIVSVVGRRRAMEDAVTVDMGVGGGEFASFAVYDGHGGSAVANACSLRLHQLLAYEIEGSCEGFDWGEIMKVCFKKMDEEVNECFFGGGGGDGPARMIGSTAVVVVVGKEEVVVANCGDSRAVMYRDGVPVALSRDHQPDRPDERARVEAAGGKIINWNGSRVLGVLATSISIGDEYLNPYVISEPEVTVNKRTRADNFLIIASDGLWDVVSNELACKVVKVCLRGRTRNKNLTEEGTSVPADAAAFLAELAIAKGSKDNISVIVVELENKSSLLDASL